MAIHEDVRTRLQGRMGELARRVGRIETDLRMLLDRDSEEQAGELENREVLEGLDKLTLAELREIHAALGRIDDGTYGRCTSCGGPVSAQRLAAMPSTAVCVGCAAGAEAASL